jgi:hypothetical protein
MDSLWNRESGSSYRFSSFFDVVVILALVVVDPRLLQIAIEVCQ